ncbi:hypothetical protein LN042_18960 [Kitasatospora sp. RB6PN24]|uniref:hypothetical protein n=1 Tax=Kitasatospora humi TaxID=2893891 RepID=UPI001E291AF6|nr:hypothetical protein [Kitasatospora humi]MCC9309137.1 hypothetical protein [Kitasatospora humi]
MAVHLRVYSPTGPLLGLLPYPADVKVQAEHNGPGALTFTYPRNAPGAELLAGDDPRIALVLDGTEQTERYLLEDDGDDPADDAGQARPIQVGCRGALALLERAVIYPAGHTPGQTVHGLDPHFPFTTASPGAILATLLQRAQSRGALTELRWDFTAAADSAGRAWPTAYTAQYDAGTDLLKTVQAMTGAGWADVRMDGYLLHAYVPDTVCAADHPGIVFYLGRDVLKGPRQRSRRAVRSHLLAAGDSGTLAEVANPTAAARYGRREAFDGRGGITDAATLAELGRVTLAGLTAASEGFTIELDPAATSARPGIDYRVGDYIRYDQRRTDPTTLEPLRVRTIATTYDATGQPSSSLELNDLFVEQRLRLQRTLDALTNGSATASRTPLPPLGDRNDTVAPKAPDSVLLGSWAYLDADGQQHAALAVSWPKVTQNADGTVYDDAGNYYVSYLLPGLSIGGQPAQWSAEQAVNGTIAHYDQLPAGQRVQARVRTVDASGNSSPWQLSEQTILASDTTPPPVPSAPVLAPLIGGIRATWDGRGAQGEEMPSDFAAVEVHAATAAGFTPNAATALDRLQGAGAAPLTGLAYGSTYYLKFVALDRAGNASAPSAEMSAIPSQVIGADLADKILTAGKWADVERASLQTTFFTGFISDDARWVKTAADTGATWTSLARPDAPTGARALAVSRMVRLEWSENLVLDPAVLYRMSIRVRQVAGSPAKVSAGVTGIAADGTTRINTAGANTVDQPFTIAASDTVLTPGAGWVTLTGFLKGYGPAAGPFWTTQPDPQKPVTLHPNVRFVRPHLVVNVDGGTSAATEVDMLTIEALEFPANVIGTVQIADATIVGAKIAQATIQDAHIGTVSASKITVGSVKADMTIAARIKTADTGARVELNSGGIGAWKADGTQTVAIAGADGSVSLIGQLRSGAAGQRIVINPSDTSLPEIRFYPTTGNNYGFLNAVGTGTSVAVGLNTGTFTANGLASTHRLYMTDSTASLETVRNDTQARWGGLCGVTPGGAGLYHVTDQLHGYLYVNQDGAWLGRRNGGVTTELWINAEVMNYRGRWNNYVAIESNYGLFTGNFQGSNWQAISLGYGATMATDMIPIITLRDGNAYRNWQVTSTNSTGFTVALSTSSPNGAFGFWCFRV